MDMQEQVLMPLAIKGKEGRGVGVCEFIYLANMSKTII